MSSQDKDPREGRGGLEFPTTRWSRILADGGSRSSQEAFEVLARRYHGPITAYIRSRWARSKEEAEEAAQEFFLWMLEAGFLSRADPERGSFRAFIKRSLQNFLHDQERKRRTLKRGGGKVVSGLESPEGGTLSIADEGAPSPEDALDDAWRKTLFTAATRALEEELRARGKAVVFEVFRDYYLSEEELDYGATAERHGVTKTDVSNHLMHAKRRFRAHLRQLVLETVRHDDDLPAELEWLFEGKGK